MYGIIMHAKCTRKLIVIQNIEDIIIVWISFTKIIVTIFDKLRPHAALTPQKKKKKLSPKLFC